MPGSVASGTLCIIVALPDDGGDYRPKYVEVTCILFSPCCVNDYSLLVPTNAHIILIYISPYPAGRHPRGAQNQIASNSQQKTDLTKLFM
jgi:hypothetical protein